MGVMKQQLYVSSMLIKTKRSPANQHPSFKVKNTETMIKYYNTTNFTDFEQENVNGQL